MNNKKLLSLLSVVIFSGVLITGVGCTAIPVSLNADYWPTESWQKSTPEDQGMRGENLDEMIKYITKTDLRIDSVIIVRNGYIVKERYFKNYKNTTLHNLYSVTKSVVSALIGIAIHEGYIEGVDQKITDFFPNSTGLKSDARKQNITLENVLTMSSGLSWEEDISYFDPKNSFRQLTDGSTSNWVEYVLSRSMDADPGSEWNYNSGGSHLLSAILQEVTGMDTLTYARLRLFDPLGISSVQWVKDPQGIYFGGAWMELRPQDMAKIGYLYLNNGTWDGEQVVPAAWVHQSQQNHIMRSEYSGYGYQWWLSTTINGYFAVGWGGQRIYIIPNLDLVVVFTAYLEEYCCPTGDFLVNYIVPSAEGLPVISSIDSPDNSGNLGSIEDIFFGVTLLSLLAIVITVIRRWRN